MSTRQLQLIHSEESWKLDQHTIEIGRAGVAAARAALANAGAPAQPTEGGNGQLSMGLDRAA